MQFGVQYDDFTHTYQFYEGLVKLKKVKTLQIYSK